MEAIGTSHRLVSSYISEGIEATAMTETGKRPKTQQIIQKSIQATVQRPEIKKPATQRVTGLYMGWMMGLELKKHGFTGFNRF